MVLQKIRRNEQVKVACCIIAIYLLAGCSPGTSNPEKKIIAQINKYKMTVEDLRYDLKNFTHDEAGFLKTESGRKQYIDNLIEKEVLLQEAQHKGIDREKDFMKSIESYWEQALLRVLLERKAKEISLSTRVHNSEIEEYYRSSEEALPFSKVKDEIKNAIKQKKETDAMSAWIEGLKKSSDIKVDKKAVEDVLK
jgi:peptidyl-prolyl cis-trans isomerase C